MRFGKLSLAAVAVASLVTAPVMAQSVSASTNTSIASSKVKRIGAASRDESKAGPGIVVGIIAAVVIIGGIILLSDDDSTSP
jgi:Na+-driven multidrug efflux pump